ncbi:hypothetical protein [Streptomyces sp. NPDC001127]|uniref:hypothetical protein n=1 Tax=Streptomyces sp. NPDC001127 TaxID=3154377 RepID=UPI00332BE14B
MTAAHELLAIGPVIVVTDGLAVVMAGRACAGARTEGSQERDGPLRQWRVRAWSVNSGGGSR